MYVIPAVFEHGIFRPLKPVELPEGTQVRIEVLTQQDTASSSPRSPEEEAHLDRVHELLSRRFDGAERDVAARHDEHQSAAESFAQGWQEARAGNTIPLKHLWE